VAEVINIFNFLAIDTFAIVGDMDGDGIPDDWDKYPNRTVADVAAEMYRLGKYKILHVRFNVFVCSEGVILKTAIKLYARLSSLCIPIGLGNVSPKLPENDEEDTLPFKTKKTCKGEMGK
jgi:hypothetical protein